MDSNKLFLFSALIIFSAVFYSFFLLILKKNNSSLFIDKEFSKPQAFHEFATPVIGGLCIYFSLLLVFFNFLFFNNIIFLDYVMFCTLFFFLGFLDDIKININPKIRLGLMILFLIILVISNNLYINKTGIAILNIWLENSDLFSLFFICLCFLFIINGSNLIDGYNGLLGFHALIITTNLFFVNYLNGNNDLASFIFFTITILVMFLIFNFPKAKIFLGDSGSYLIGTFIALCTIQTSIANPEISPFYFCILLFYLFFEVFFSFFRKIFIEKKSPVKPDDKHLHMLIYKILLKKNKNKLKSNWLTSVIINLIYFAFTIPPIVVLAISNNLTEIGTIDAHNFVGVFCKYYSVILFGVYFITYKKASGKIRKFL
jgi:UDP-GlcNAc:undecaprenyl-phosphate/decaprenyl-phosphate GlcNAc-1-phosphate transferase